MKNLFSAILIMGCTLSLTAQDLPKPSPSAKVEQRVGLTDIAITYPRPGLKGRTIWGDLVPYDEIWRAGANKATLFETSSDIMIGDKKLPSGAYSLFIIPKKDGNWTCIFNTETELWGTGDYDASKDQLRVEMKTQSVHHPLERMSFHFENVDMTSADLMFSWEMVEGSLPIKADPKSQVQASIDKALEEAEEDKKWRVYRNAASYAEDAGDMTAQGLEWIKKSIELQENWYSYWVYAGLQAQNGDKAAAIKMAEKSIELGKKDAKENEKEFAYEERLRADIAKWSK